jgi:XTP/dITP diphosphohydrolase
LSKPKLLLATNNRAKLKEYSVLLQGIPCEVVSLVDVGIELKVDETGETFEANATLKAKTYASLTNLTALADDSGLEVDALNGEPGVRSARYAGEGASQAELIQHLLRKLSDMPWEERSARFKCVIAIAAPDGEVITFHGECQGIITFEPRGKGGFGYDPVFYISELGKTMAELTMREKNKVSHRGKAVKEARPYLELRERANRKRSG